MPEPRPRTPAQIAASRRNGSRSRGPVTAAGKARASRNAVKHGLTAMTHLVLAGEDEGELEALTFRMLVETGATSEIEARLARRLAIAFWKGERAERMEVALLDAAPRMRPPAYGVEWEAADPLTTFDVRRFNAIRGAQAQQGREIRCCLAELRRLRAEPMADTDESEDHVYEGQNGTDEPAPVWENEPESLMRNEPGDPSPANDDAASPAGSALRNEPGEPAGRPENEPGDPALAALTPAQRAVRAELDRLLESGEEEPDLGRMYQLTRELCLPLRRAG
ncbi:MAG: hypothetical protein U1E52_21960 [Geminicoccaceae bacterium]